MPKPASHAAAEFWRIIRWIGLAAVLMVVGALTYLAISDGLSLHMVVATVLGVFVSVMLGCGLFALAFFSDKSGHDDRVGSATSHRRDPDE